MSVKTLADLKARFETGDTPTAQDFIDFLDSFLHAQLGNFPDPLPEVSGEDLTNIGDALPDPLPARDGSALTNINPKEYNVPGSMPVPSYATANTFVLSGDFTISAADVNNRVFLIGRRLRIQIGGAYEYTEVTNAVFAAGITTVTTLDNMSGSPIQEVAVGVITPFALGGAVGATAAGAVSLTKDETIAGNKKHTGSNTFQERVNAADSTGGTANAITAAFNPGITGLVDKMRVVVRATVANTGATTFDPGTGAVLIEKVEAGVRATLAAGDITGASHDLDLVWNAGAGRWLLLNPKMTVTALTTMSSPAAQTIPAAVATMTFVHGLGVGPSLVRAVLVAGSAPEHGFTQNQEVEFSNSSVNVESPAVSADGTNVYVEFGGNFIIASRTTHLSVVATANDATKWQVKVRAFK